MSDQALHDQIAQLTERLASLERGTYPAPVPAPGWGETDFIQIVPEPATTVPMHTLVRIEGLPGDARAFRRLLEAVALCHNLPAPEKDVPKAWVPVLKRIHAARIEGATWAAALTRAGLVPPADANAHLETMKAELDELYDRIPALVDQINKRAATSIVRQRLLQQLGQLLM